VAEIGASGALGTQHTELEVEEQLEGKYQRGIGKYRRGRGKEWQEQWAARCR
jgi:hypothetical protein